MTPWWQGRMVAFDVETTGVDVEEARIVSATVACVGGGQATEVMTAIADPGIPIPDEAAAVHGITTERARADGLPALEVVRGVRTLLEATRHLPLVAYNVRFDLTVFDRECRRHGIEPFVPAVVIDPLVLDKYLDPYRRGSRRLEAVCEHYDARLDGAHDSAHDAIAAARVAYRIGQRSELGHMTPEGLHRAQQKWAREQRLSFAKYRRKQGDAAEAERIEAMIGWPMIAARDSVRR